jgi:hypothetical protein
VISSPALRSYSRVCSSTGASYSWKPKLFPTFAHGHTARERDRDRDRDGDRDGDGDGDGERERKGCLQERGGRRTRGASVSGTVYHHHRHPPPPSPPMVSTPDVPMAQLVHTTASATLSRPWSSFWSLTRRAPSEASTHQRLLPMCLHTQTRHTHTNANTHEHSSTHGTEQTRTPRPPRPSPRLTTNTRHGVDHQEAARVAPCGSGRRATS